MNNKLPLLWLRAETKAFEQRTLLTPGSAAQLLAHGYDVVVERCEQRIFDDDEYHIVGCRLVNSGAWHTAPSDAIILGLKELEVHDGPFNRRHVHFAHVFKEQQGWQEILSQFVQGGGALYDLEYLTDNKQKRVAAFGYWAGFVGAAVAVMAWCEKQRGQTLPALSSWPDKQALLNTVKTSLATVESMPDGLLIGALGRCGSGAVELFESCELSVTQWDMSETAEGGPFDAVRDHDILVNCVFINNPLPPFTSIEHLLKPQRKLEVISDVSCDPTGKHNPLPIYSHCTSMDKPLHTIMPSNSVNPSLDLIAIDHLPSLLPRESSEDFSQQLLPTLLEIKYLDQGAWIRAYDEFTKHTSYL